MRAAGARVMVVLAISSAGAACSSFGAAPSTEDVLDGGPGTASDAGADVSERDAAAVDGGCGVPPFATKITGAEPADDGWDYDVTYGPQGELSVDRADEGDGVLRATMTAASAGRGKVYVREIDARDARCVAFEVKLRVARFPEQGSAVLTSALRFASNTVLAITIAPGSKMEFVQQLEGGGEHRKLGRAAIADEEWHVLRVAYAPGPTVEASIDGVAIPIDQAEVMPFSAPTRFDVGVTFAAAESVARFDIDEVSLF